MCFSIKIPRFRQSNGCWSQSKRWNIHVGHSIAFWGNYVSKRALVWHNLSCLYRNTHSYFSAAAFNGQMLKNHYASHCERWYCEYDHARLFWGHWKRWARVGLVWFLIILSVRTYYTTINWWYGMLDQKLEQSTTLTDCSGGTWFPVIRVGSDSAEERVLAPGGNI